MVFIPAPVQLCYPVSCRCQYGSVEHSTIALINHFWTILALEAWYSIESDSKTSCLEARIRRYTRIQDQAVITHVEPNSRNRYTIRHIPYTQLHQVCPGVVVCSVHRYDAVLTHWSYSVTFPSGGTLTQLSVVVTTWLSYSANVRLIQTVTLQFPHTWIMANLHWK